MEIEDFNTCFPAKIKSYNPVEQTCTVMVSVEDYYTGINFSYRKQEAPLLVDVPVHVLQGGGWSLTVPIKEGDNCLVVYAQKGYDHWLYSGLQETGLIDGRPTSEHYREFSIRDALCIVGFNPIPSAIPNYNPDDMEIRNADLSQRITLKKSGSIEVHTTMDVIVTAENVTSTSKTATVTAPKTKIIADETVEVLSPLTTFSGNIKVGGSILMGGAKKGSVCELNGTLKMNGDMESTGGATFASDVTASGKSVSTHTHKDAEGRPTSAPE